MRNSQKRALYESIMKDVSKIIKKRLNEDGYTLHKDSKSSFGYSVAQDIVTEMKYTLRDFCKGTRFNTLDITTSTQQKVGLIVVELTYRGESVGTIGIDTYKDRLILNLEELDQYEDRSMRIFDQISELKDRLEAVADQYGYRIVNNTL